MSGRLGEPCEYIGHSNILWNYMEVNYVFWIKGNLWALYVLPMCCDVWLPGDYLARYYSLCDIGILAPIFVMVIEFRLCDGNEFRLCDGILVLSLWRRWVPSLWWQISSVFVIALSCGLGFGIVLLLVINYIVCSFMRAFWEVLCHVILFILVIFFLEMVL